MTFSLSWLFLFRKYQNQQFPSLSGRIRRVRHSNQQVIEKRREMKEYEKSNVLLLTFIRHEWPMKYLSSEAVSSHGWCYPELRQHHCFPSVPLSRKCCWVFGEESFTQGSAPAPFLSTDRVCSWSWGSTKHTELKTSPHHTTDLRPVRNSLFYQHSPLWSKCKCPRQSSGTMKSLHHIWHIYILIFYKLWSHTEMFWGCHPL